MYVWRSVWTCKVDCSIYSFVCGDVRWTAVFMALCGDVRWTAVCMVLCVEM